MEETRRAGVSGRVNSGLRFKEPFACESGVWHHKGVRFANFLQTMNKPKIIAYLKPTCGWSNGVRAILRKYDLPFEDRDIINDPAQRQEMMARSGQPLSPCVEIDGHMLADVSGDEVEAWMLANNVVQPNDRTAEAPTNQSCSRHTHLYANS